jgi:parallel beta-helix repeat protein
MSASSRIALTVGWGLVLAATAHTAQAVDIDVVPFHITKPGTYTLTANLHQIGSTAITIAASDVVLDLGGFTLSGTGGFKGGYGYGVGVEPGHSNITIQNGTIDEFEIESGIMLNGVTGCTVSNVTVSQCGGGIAMIDGGGHTIEDNTLDHNVHANIATMHCSGNVIEGNTCTGAAWGIRLGGASSGNSILDNTCIGLGGSNTTPIDLTDTDSNTLIGNNLTNGWIGIYGVNSDTNIISNNVCTGNASGMTVHGDLNNIFGNQVNGNLETGIAGGGRGNTLDANTCNGNGTGIYFNGAVGCTITGNTANNNVHDGIVVWSSGGKCGSNTINLNSASGNTTGIQVFACNDNGLANNIASANTTYGIVLSISNSNVLSTNTARSNGSVDLVDDSCLNNTWQQSTYLTSSGACIQ